MNKKLRFHIKPVIKRKKSKKLLEHHAITNIGAVINKKIDDQKWKLVAISKFKFQ